MSYILGSAASESAAFMASLNPGAAILPPPDDATKAWLAKREDMTKTLTKVLGGVAFAGLVYVLLPRPRVTR